MGRARQQSADWAREIGEHRRALEAFLAAAEAVDGDWNMPRADGKWSAAQVAEHVRLTYATLLSELAGGVGMRVRTSWLRREVLRRVVMPWMLRRRRFPRGAPAVREIRPGEGPFDRATVLAGVRAEGERFLGELERLDLDRFGGLTHPFFGRMQPLGGLRLITLHTDHHRAQIAGATDRGEVGGGSA